MDVADRAQLAEEARRDDALARALTPLPERPSAKWCERCGERIPEPRRAALPGVQLCVECQRLKEHSGGLRAA